MAGWSALVLVTWRLATTHLSDAVFVVGASLFTGIGSGILGWVIRGSFRGRDLDLAHGHFEVTDLALALSDLVREFIDDLTGMDGEVQIMSTKLDRLRKALMNLTPMTRETDRR